MAVNDKIIAQRGDGEVTPPDLNTDIFALLESLRVEHANAVNQSPAAVTALTETTFSRLEAAGEPIDPVTVETIKSYLNILSNSKWIGPTYNGSEITVPTSGVTKINFSDYETWRTRVDTIAGIQATNTGYRSGYRSGFNSGYRSGFHYSFDRGYDAGFNSGYRSGYRSCNYNSGYKECWGAYTGASGSCGANGFRSGDTSSR